jgi:hypothetical protein
MAWTLRSHQHDFRLSIVGHFRPKLWAGQGLGPPRRRARFDWRRQEGVPPIVWSLF